MTRHTPPSRDAHGGLVALTRETVSNACERANVYVPFGQGLSGALESPAHTLSIAGSASLRG
jgi:hypothetical protein